MALHCKTPSLIFLVAVVLLGGAAAEVRAQGAVNKCVGPDGKVTLSQVKCPNDRAPTAADVAASAQAVLDAAKADELRRAAARADRQMRDKFPDETALRTAYVAEIQAVTAKMRPTMKRLDALIVERKPIDEELKFYVGKPLSPELKRKLDVSESQFAALATVFNELQSEIADIVVKYGRWRDRLLKLWAGSEPGSLGLLDTVPPPVR